MQFVETSAFTERLPHYLSEDAYRLLQLELAVRPRRGKLIRGTGGLLKIRWRDKGKGKRGGVRVIYYYVTRESVIYLLDIYSKRERTDLTPAQRRALRAIVAED